MIAVGILIGVLLVVFLPGMPWATMMAGAPDSHDLAAQMSMAAAAWWMVGITGTSTAVGGIGLYLIARTLQEAKRSADAGEEAVKATERIGKRQVRAYLNIEKAKAKLDSSYIWIAVDAELHNSGQSPANNVRGTAAIRFTELYTYPDGEVATDTLLTLHTNFQSPAVGAGQTVELRLTFPVIDTKPPLREIFDGFSNRAIEIDVSTAYVDVFGDQDTSNCVMRRMISTLDQLREGGDLRISAPDK
ncbi:MAG: hypothetical protein Devi2KO_04210 [Devosia indica]